MARDTTREVRPGRLRPTQSRARRTQRLILESARSCFNDNGFQSTTIKQIAGAAGVSVGAIYEHFKDKATLFREVGHMEVLRLRDESFLPFQDALDGNLPSDVPIPVHLIRLGIRGSVESQSRFPRLLAELVERTPHEPEMLAFVDRVHDEATRFIEGLIVLFKAREPGPEAALAAGIILPMCEATVRHFALRESGLSEEQVIEELTKVVVGYLFPPGPG
jgi:AcrR family transcriptional regulator